MKTAILDLGTNTFNLLVAEKTSAGFEFIHRDKSPVKLGANGFKSREITPEAMERGLNAIAMLLLQVQQLGVEEVYAFATSAMRDARNSGEFIREVKKQFGIDIEIISGEKEAELIYLGVRYADVFTEEHALIMDIGGGSTEFIISDKNGPVWMKSYDLGAARMVSLFNPEDPILPATTKKILEYTTEHLADLFRNLKKYKVSHLIGSSGSFDSMVDMIAAQNGLPYPNEEKSNPLDINQLQMTLDKMIASTLKQRQGIKGLISMRVDFIVMSSLLIKTILNAHPISNVTQCAYSLKEGALFKTIEEGN